MPAMKDTPAIPPARQGQAPAKLRRDEFHLQFVRSFADPTFDQVREALGQVEDVAWSNYEKGRKAPVTQKAGPGFADPDYDLSVEWKDTRDRLLAAEQRQKDPATQSRVLLDLRLGPQRRFLPRRDLEDLAHESVGARNPRSRGHRGRFAGPEPADVLV